MSLDANPAPENSGLRQRNWLAIQEACLFYGVSRRTLYNWLKAKRLRTRRSPGGRQFVFVDPAEWEERSA